MLCSGSFGGEKKFWRGDNKSLEVDRCCFLEVERGGVTSSSGLEEGVCSLKGGSLTGGVAYGVVD